jgi:hypothetical protein
MLLLPILSQEKSGIARTDQRMHSQVWFARAFVAKAKESYDCLQKRNGKSHYSLLLST